MKDSQNSGKRVLFIIKVYYKSISLRHGQMEKMHRARCAGMGTELPCPECHSPCISKCSTIWKLLNSVLLDFYGGFNTFAWWLNHCHLWYNSISSPSLYLPCYNSLMTSWFPKQPGAFQTLCGINANLGVFVRGLLWTSKDTLIPLIP